MDSNPGSLKRAWIFLRRPSAKYSILTLLVAGFFSGIIFWGGFNTGMEATNKLEFCVSCHEMRDTVYQEYKKSVHYSNRSGVRAVCSDCHVPKDWGHKMLRKIQASNEVWEKITGFVDTPEKFEKHRMELATHEWARMKGSDSRECRNCHSFDAMSGDKQKQTVFNKHMKAKAEGQTCIDCHKGIAHHLPKEYRDPDEE
ncbi:cytochrome c-type protein [Sulfurimicrobium lacus]|uniref:Cytochrome c-type protein n=1 Tax=Sulfurimicrobium lacus TaxID=2715678 RepID=A0A6F8VD44_9PROT|nr:NapC/NirT family cytochrome c [Sulfurimicrobium lacus]BCB27071.1 cytochrome c-type protein [Sulfurimicrobium lacus]